MKHGISVDGVKGIGEVKLDNDVVVRHVLEEVSGCMNCGFATTMDTKA